MVEDLKTNEQDSLTGTEMFYVIFAPRACRTRCQSMFQRDLQKSENKKMPCCGKGASSLGLAIHQRGVNVRYMSRQVDVS